MYQVYSSPPPISLWLFTSIVTYGNKLPSPATPHCGSKPRNAWWKFIRPLPTDSYLAADRTRCQCGLEMILMSNSKPASLLQTWPPLAFLILFLHFTYVFGQLGYCESKPQWVITSHLLGWLLSKEQKKEVLVGMWRNRKPCAPLMGM